MAYRISPAWWPVIGLCAPVLLPLLGVRNRRFRRHAAQAQQVNQERIAQAKPLEMPALDDFEITVLVEQKAAQGFLSAPGVSYLIRTDLGSLLFDVGFGPECPALDHNAARLGIALDKVDALVISHLHPDHMGGFRAAKTNQVALPAAMGSVEGRPCFLPAEARVAGARAAVVRGPQMLAAGVASTGPLARSLFLMGWTEEQAVVARLKDKGLVIVTGCGHPTIDVILQMVGRMSDEPTYALGGGLHFPVTDSPHRKPGLKVQMIWGTGKPPWRRITDDDLTRTIANINVRAPQRVCLSAHDTCDHAIGRFAEELKSETTVLEAGATYRI